MKWYSFVLLCNVCVIKCHSIAMSEIEDFNNFIKETSQLDQNVKSSFAPDYDEEESISDDAWEESGKFEGDLILNDRQRRMIVANVAEGLARNGLIDTTKRWPKNQVIYFIQREHFTSEQMEVIQNGIADLAQASCVKFKPYKKGDRNAVVIQGSRRGCFSQVGFQGGYQVLNLSARHPAGRGCFRHGTVVHELLHTLGFFHMQSSHDRDEYIDVVWENIVRQARHNFRKYNSYSVSDFGVGYDYDSVLHYSRKAFSSNGQDTIIPKRAGSNIGQRDGLSDKDVRKLNKMYCDADSDLLDENSETKKPVANKKAKNRPFEGHGIGYQQGKTVIIKHEDPQEEVADAPQIIYHFRSAPETVQAAPFAQGIETGKEVTYSYHPITSSIQNNNVVIGNKPYAQNQQPKEIVLRNTYYTALNSDASDNDEDLKEALHRFSSIVSKSHETPYPVTSDYDYSKYMKSQTDVNGKPREADVESLHQTQSESNDEELNSSFSYNRRPAYTTQGKTRHFYGEPEEYTQKLRVVDPNINTSSKEFRDQLNFEYAPSKEAFGLQKHNNYSDAYSSVPLSGIKNVSKMKSLVHVVDSYEEQNVKSGHNDNKPYSYDTSNLYKHPSIKNAHITEKKPFNSQYSYSAPVSHTWLNDRHGDYYKNKYPDSVHR